MNAEPAPRYTPDAFMGPVLAIVCLGLLIGIVRAVEGGQPGKHILAILVFGYVLRLIIQFNLQSVSLFSYGGGGLRGDSQLYEMQGAMIANLWEHTHFGPVDHELIPQFDATTLPGYVYATIIYLNGGKTLLGCVSLVALLACLTCFNLYRLALELGADDQMAKRVMIVTFFSPGFLLFTSDTTKDGLVAFFITTALSCSFRLSRKLALTHVILGLVCIVALWFTRFYLVFVATVPLLIGLQGLRNRSIVRPLLTLIALVGALLVIGTYTKALSAVSQTAQAAFETGTSREVLAGNASDGSGVTFDDGGNPFGQLPLKLLYTVFSPFPWASGSIAFQLAKVDVFVWYYLIYRALKAAKERFTSEPVLVTMFASFIVPLTIAYATTMANVGLIYRQRIPVVLMTAVLAAISFRAASRKPMPTPAAPRMPTRNGTFHGRPLPLRPMPRRSDEVG